ncbi:cytochrome c oxidase assembly protein [Aestuariimicrobium kwangyangense]|uniref:cytochrome c oxidase assembly protein n=1 Tax=Aestuariimicrobium kwangyangense TaxID=396389 RepID=UPI0003B3DD41|nr:cytochrome c oxidase assembly protein [Aestuariimicrobium kwangyangense]
MTAPLEHEVSTMPDEALTREPTGRGAQAVSLLLVVLVTVAAVMVPVQATLAGGEQAYRRIGLTHPGALTGSITAALRGLADLASATTVGALVWLLLLGRTRSRRAEHGRCLEPDDRLVQSVLRHAAGWWLATAAGSVLFTAADSNGLPVETLSDTTALRFALFSGDLPRAWMVSVEASFVIVLLASLARGWTPHLVALWAALVGSLAPVVVGQVLVGPNHDFGGDAAVVQTVVGQALLGVALVMVLRLATGQVPGWRTGGLPAGWIRAAWVGWFLLVATEVVVTWFKLAGSGPTSSPTGMLALVRFGALVLLGVALAVIGRRPAVGTLVGGLAAGATVVVGAAMTRISPPLFFVPTSISQTLLGFDVPDAPSLRVLLTQWRPNLLFCTLVATALVAYGWGLWRLRLRREGWPAMRTLAWVLGWLVVLIATSSGFGKYSAPDFAVHMGVHMTLNMLAPVLIVLGAPITLALRALRPSSEPDQVGVREKLVALLPSRLLAFVYHPLLVFALYIGSYYGLYLTGLFGALMRFHWAHQLMNLHFLIVGALYFGLVIGVDPNPRRLPHLAKLGILMAAMPFHAFFGVILMDSTRIVAETFYRYLALPWAHDLAAIQRVAGGVAWAGSELPLLVVVLALGAQWARQDDKEAKRIDRHLDTGLDDSHEAYNVMLQRLASEGEARP